MSKQLVVKEDNTKKKLGKAYHYISLRTAGIKLAGSAGKNRMYFPTKEEATAKAMELNAQQLHGGIITEHPEKSVGAAIDDFCKKSIGREDKGAICSKHLNNVCEGAMAWKTLLVNGVEFSEIQCIDVKATMIEDLLDENFKHPRTGKRLAYKTIKNKLDPLKGVFDLALRNDYCVKNPVKEVKFEETKYKGEEEAEKETVDKVDLDLIAELINVAFENHSTSEAMALAFSCQTGLRFGEMSALKWKYIDFDRMEVDKETGETHLAPCVWVRVAMRKQRDGSIAADIPKKTTKGHDNKKRRRVFLFPSLVTWLKQWRLQSEFSGDEDYVFPMENGKPHQSADHLRVEVLQKCCAKVEGLTKMTWHELRHVFATLCLHELGSDLIRIADLFGHQTVDTTREIYGHWIQDLARDASDATKMDNKMWKGRKRPDPFAMQQCVGEKT